MRPAGPALLGRLAVVESSGMTESALTEQQLNELRSQLEQRRDNLKLQLEQSEAATQPVTLDQQSVGRVSRIDAIQQQQMAIAGKKQTAQLLRRIELALQRIEDDEYGQCMQCGESIRFARLQVQPDASLCLVCQSEAESG